MRKKYYDDAKENAAFERVADDFFDRKMGGGVLWQKIKRKKSMLQ